MGIFILFLVLVLAPALLGWALADFFGPFSGEGWTGRIHEGDAVVYCKQKTSSRPGPRARDIHPAPGGEAYSYRVDKFWVVEDVLIDGHIIVATRTGKRHTLDPDDANLKKAGLIKRLRYRSKFPHL